MKLSLFADDITTYTEKPKEFTDYLEEWANLARLQNTILINKNQLYFIIANNWKWNKNSILIALRQ